MIVLGSCCLFFFFKQKTAYEMRISDWSSDVCSSDLGLKRFCSGQGSGAQAYGYIPRLADAAMDKIGQIPQGRRNGFDLASARRSEERRVGKEWVSTCRSRWSPYH